MFSAIKSIPLMYKYALAAFTLVALGAIAVSLNTETILHFLVVVITAMIVDEAINFAKKRKLVLVYSAYISGVIIALLIPLETPLAIKVLVPAIAIVGKHLIRWRGKHVFNPASLALAIASLFSLAAVTWHGTSNWMLVGLVGLLLMLKIEKLPTGLSFLLTFSILQLAYNSLTGVDVAGTITNFLLSGPLLFFGFFMVIEPKTSVFTKKGQIVFGTVTAVLSFASQFIVPALFPLIGLLITNILSRTINKHTLK